jgi:dihydrodipicolinate synthase/N-acetylneuraminate lyase
MRSYPRLMLSFSGLSGDALPNKLPRPLRGVITAMVTPLDQDLNLDRKGLERLVEHLIAGGVHGIFILGTTGEAPNLPYDTRFAVIEQTCKLAGNR